MFEGQTALVTGASKGIGAATARALAAAGAHVVLTSRDTKGLEAVEEAIFAAGGSATIAPVDLAEPDGIARLATAVGQRWDKLDILVINAALLPELTSVAQIDQKAWNKAMTVNVLATQALIANFDHMLRASPDGRIVGLTSTVATAPRPFWGAYASSKAAFEVLLDCHAQEVANISKVRVAIVNPGATRTAMRARAYPGEDPGSVKPPEVVADRIVSLLSEPFMTGHRETVNPAR
ncbi:NAD(P)-dependent dehydrogenase (short-subunit alcohol dehydrogenase family) [Novosphingobium chloroacetimidivorans]|uniref:NAD(P)-dependent dehydrogenase (Short-subunit alcohol dehydrogenase family) n=1 Tax=Novosphingobium chloroacetimidivorans TaxID=1428314 RepID=A0A7W7KBH5_9SPHN|nr:SDR family NAD(P)-dependent oxidoreductase [Novosphingobium chloroacetimidivorans]MBB4859772.1 NAD(P)-dependent dehydrogenase (short-subunit alcohol dehydrogenase family) [Novosphingobium chloroacetimidivorans]